MGEFTTPAFGTTTDSQAYEFLDTTSFVRVPSEATDGHHSVVEMRLREGHAPPMHVHERADEVIHVVDGELEAHTPDTVTVVAASGSIVFPQGGEHSLVAREETTIVTSTAPGGFDEFVRSAGEPTDDESVPSQPPGEDAIGRVIKAASAHGIDIVGPPPGGPQ